MRVGADKNELREELELSSLPAGVGAQQKPTRGLSTESMHRVQLPLHCSEYRGEHLVVAGSGFLPVGLRPSQSGWIESYSWRRASSEAKKRRRVASHTQYDSGITRGNVGIHDWPYLPGLIQRSF